MKRALDDIAEKDPRGRGARPEQFIDASLMQELEKEGFIKSCGVNASLMDQLGASITRANIGNL
jgi:hypothetical protein